MSQSFRIVPAGDSVVIVEFEARIDAGVNAQVIALAEAIHAASVGGVRDVVPTYRSVAIYFDPLRTDSVALAARVEHETARLGTTPAAARPSIRIPVRYGGEFGADLADVAAFAHMKEADVIRIHSARAYRVFMLGNPINLIKYQPVFAVNEQDCSFVRYRVLQPPIPIMATFEKAKKRIIMPALQFAVGDVMPFECTSGCRYCARVSL